jgi:hypothetical protein
VSFQAIAPPTAFCAAAGLTTAAEAAASPSANAERRSIFIIGFLPCSASTGTIGDRSQPRLGYAFR